MLHKIVAFKLRAFLSLIRVIPNRFWKALIGSKAIEFDGRTLQPRAQVFCNILKMDGPPTQDKHLAKFRHVYDSASQFLDGKPAPLASVTNIRIPLEGRTLGARIYERDNPWDVKGAILYFHGGGFISGSIASHDNFCRRLAHKTGQRVIAVDYRLGPEHRYPAFLDDAIDCWDWLQANASSLCINPKHITVSGDSAGGNLSALIANHAAAQPKGHKPYALALIYPFIDPDQSTSAFGTLASFNLVLGDAILEYFLARFRPTQDADAEAMMQDPRFVPILQPDMIAKWPKTAIYTCGFDPLRLGAEKLHQMMVSNGQDVSYVEYKDLFHGFITMSTCFREAEDIVDHIANHIG